MNANQIGMLASDILDNRIYSALVVTRYPKEDLAELYKFLSNLDADCVLDVMSKRIKCFGKTVQFSDIENKKDCYLFSGAQFNAIYLTKIIAREEEDYLRCRLRAPRRCRVYLEYLPS
jgi:hypothetical protein